jgi:hypothetical protein
LAGGCDGYRTAERSLRAGGFPMRTRLVAGVVVTAMVLAAVAAVAGVFLS